MALNSTPRRRFGVALGVVLTGVAAGLIGFAGIASAHTPKVSAECKGEVTTLRVDLNAYATSKTKENRVKITDGDKVLADTGFQQSYKKSFEVSATEVHTFKVDVKAFDDPRYNYFKELTVEACVTPPTTTTTTTTESTPPSTTVPPTTTTTTSTTPPSTQTTTTTSTTTVLSTTTVPPTTTSTDVEEAALASTGASIGLPLGIAGVLLVGGGVLLFIVRRRSKA